MSLNKFFKAQNLSPILAVILLSIKPLPAAPLLETADLSALQTSTEAVTATQYSDFLNHEAVTDSNHLYNEAMETDPASACIVRFGQPGSYYYEVIAGRENFAVTYVNKNDEEIYSIWFQNGKYFLSIVEDDQNPPISNLLSSISQAHSSLASNRINFFTAIGNNEKTLTSGDSHPHQWMRDSAWHYLEIYFEVLVGVTLLKKAFDCYQSRNGFELISDDESSSSSWETDSEDDDQDQGSDKAQSEQEWNEEITSLTRQPPFENYTRSYSTQHSNDDSEDNSEFFSFKTAIEDPSDLNALKQAFYSDPKSI